MTYRPEIDGLRAIAVGVILLFHAGFTGFSGGFVGVDVFFVISGYLITGLILKDQAAGHFSILRFYQRRARRILPALLVMIAVTLGAGFLLSPPMQFQWLAQSATAASVFASNIYFMLKGGDYFAQDAFFPLKHTWSLAVEEQFYLLFPAAMILAGRFGRRAIVWMIVSVLIASLALAEGLSGSGAHANYYNPAPRAWELLAGAVCALIGTRAQQRWFDLPVLAGLAMIVWAAMRFDQDTPFPSLPTTLPILGTCLIILFAVKGTLGARLLASRGMVGVGLLSYSLYLWHYPVFVFAKYYWIDTAAPLAFAALLALVFVLSFLSYRLVETPVRFTIRTPEGQNMAAVCLLLASAGLAVVAFGINSSGGMPGRGNLSGLPADYYEHAGKIPRFTTGLDGRACSRTCTALRSGGTAATWLLVGDSHANDFRVEVLEAAREEGANLSYLIIARCNYALGDCLNGVTRLHAAIEDLRPERVFFVSALGGHGSGSPYRLASGTAKLIAGMLEGGTSVTLLRPRPRFAEDPIRMALAGRMAQIALDPNWRTARDGGDALIDGLGDSHGNLQVIDQTKLLIAAGCGQLDCFNGHTANGLPLYRDTNHLTEYGAHLVFRAVTRN